MPVTINGISYILDTSNNTASVTSKSPVYSGTIIIPSDISSNSINYSVTSIGDYAFYSCIGLTSITIPNSVTIIYQNAFHYCSGLTSITIPNSVTIIYQNAFRYCSSLSSVTFPNSVTIIGANAFLGDINLKTVIFTNPSNVTSVSSSVFYVTLGSQGSVTYYNTPSNNDLPVALKTYTYPSNTLIVYNDNAYIDGIVYVLDTSNNTASVTSKSPVYSGSIMIPSTVTYNLNNYSITSIGAQAFQSCTGLTSVTIPGSITIIGDYAFQGDTTLLNVYWSDPSNITSVSDSAFDETLGPQGSVTYYNTPSATLQKYSYPAGTIQLLM